MDDFREWLSDNLRYFMLGGGILVVVLVLFFGIRACVGGRRSSNNDSGSETVNTQEGADSGGAETQTQTIENPLVTANEDVSSLIKSYYTALGNKDVDALKDIVVDLAPTDQARVSNASDYIESYEVGEIYTKNGMTDGSYVVYTCFYAHFPGVSTAAPGLSQMYVMPGTDGKLEINGTEDAELTNYMNGLRNDTDLQELIKRVQAANDKAVTDDAALANFLNGLGNAAAPDSTDAAADDSGEYMTVTEACNVREGPGSDYEVIGGYDEGEQVKVTGRESDWVQIDMDGETGYIYSGLLQ